MTNPVNPPSQASNPSVAATTKQPPRSRLVFRERSPLEPPVYTIDLSLPPRDRHREICRDYKAELHELLPLYDEVLSYTPFPSLLKFIAKGLLRGLHSKEETEEIKGIVEEAGVPKHLVVAYNTFLDLFSGCVSGGIRVPDAGPEGKDESVVHFRGLDWDMDPLRDLIICVEYVQEGAVVARAITYAGYTGCLTGVRKGLSMSMNYRTRLNSSSSTFAHRRHQLSLLLGLRPSISSHLRGVLLNPDPVPALSELAESLPTFRSSPCYLTFCSPSSVLLIEKDLTSAVVRTDDGRGGGDNSAKRELLVATNHDQTMENWRKTDWDEAIRKWGLSDMGGVRNLVNDSVERKQRMMDLWRETAQIERKGRRVKLSTPLQPKVAHVEDVKKWLQAKPVVNETTHFSCIMDPSVEGGGLLWARIYPDPVNMHSDSD